jgi:hypothetical protein
MAIKLMHPATACRMMLQPTCVQRATLQHYKPPNGSLMQHVRPPSHYTEATHRCSKYTPHPHLSASLIVLSLCAMVSTVHDLKACRSVACSTPSAAWSTLLVASSSTRMRLERSSARA